MQEALAVPHLTPLGKDELEKIGSTVSMLRTIRHDSPKVAEQIHQPAEESVEAVTQDSSDPPDVPTNSEEPADISSDAIVGVRLGDPTVAPESIRRDVDEVWQ